MELIDQKTLIVELSCKLKGKINAYQRTKAKSLNSYLNNRIQELIEEIQSLSFDYLEKIK